MNHQLTKTEKSLMVKFGEILRMVRKPDEAEYRNLAARDYWEKLTQESLPPGKQSSKPEAFQTFEELLVLPQNFRDYQRHARRLGLKMMSIREVADQLGISKNTLHDYEKGNRYPPAEFLFEYCSLLELSPEFLMNYWIRCHPNSKVRENKRLLRVQGYFGGMSEDINSPERRAAIDFFSGAIRYAIYLTNANFILGEKANEVAYCSALVVERTFSKGLALDPKSIKPDKAYYEEQLKHFE
ncbi:helix-turn-helix domain-containing protein [Microbulbifer sp. ANSA003]|uniref:helix-turn-helix domain-containing protein n=1 Tax=Microbulbifer sp. ANSA003 TaxID=3243360 RepID=UPI004041C799